MSMQVSTPMVMHGLQPDPSVLDKRGLSLLLHGFAAPTDSTILGDLAAYKTVARLFDNGRQAHDIMGHASAALAHAAAGGLASFICQL